MDGLNDYDWAGLVEKVAYAIIILLITWILARAVKWAFAKLVGRIGFLQRSGNDGRTLGESLGQIAALVIWLFGLVAVLQVFALERVLDPITELLNGLLEFLPNIIGAAFVFIVGALIAKILRQLIETSLRTVNFDQFVSRGAARAEDTLSTDPETGTPRPGARTATARDTSAAVSKTLATVVYALVMIVVTIAALQILGISSISNPAERMLTAIFEAVPNIIAAALLLGLGIMIARFAGDLLEQILAGFGTDRAVAELGVETSGDRSASSVLARIAQVAIVLFFAVMAAKLLDFPQITEFLTEVLELGGKVLFGAAIIAAGFFVASLLARMMGDGLATDVVRYATIVLFVAMGLRFMGVANSIIELAFGALVVGGALAAAIAFGLGGRDAAARTLSRLESRTAGPAAGSTTPPPPAPGSTSDPLT